MPKPSPPVELGILHQAPDSAIPPLSTLQPHIESIIAPFIACKTEKNSILSYFNVGWPVDGKEVKPPPSLSPISSLTALCMHHLVTIGLPHCMPTYQLSYLNLNP